MKEHVKHALRKQRTDVPRVPRPAYQRLRNPHQLRQLFGAFEGVSELRRLCAHEVAHANETEQLFGMVFHEDDESGLRRWRHQFDRITDCWRLLDQAVRDSRINLTEFQQVYRCLRTARTAWSHYHAHRTVPLSLFDQIIGQVRELLISCAAQT